MKYEQEEVRSRAPTSILFLVFQFHRLNSEYCAQRIKYEDRVCTRLFHRSTRKNRKELMARTRS